MWPTSASAVSAGSRGFGNGDTWGGPRPFRPEHADLACFLAAPRFPASFWGFHLVRRQPGCTEVDTHRRHPWSRSSRSSDRNTQVLVRSLGTCRPVGQEPPGSGLPTRATVPLRPQTRWVPHSPFVSWDLYKAVCTWDDISLCSSNALKWAATPGGVWAPSFDLPGLALVHPSLQSLSCLPNFPSPSLRQALPLPAVAVTPTSLLASTCVYLSYRSMWLGDLFEPAGLADFFLFGELRNKDYTRYFSNARNKLLLDLT